MWRVSRRAGAILYLAMKGAMRVRQEQESFDLSASPELLRLAEEVHATGRPRVLRRDGEVLALLLPVSGGKRRGLKKRDLSAQDVEDFRSAAGSWPDADVDAFLANIYAARDVTDDRPPVDL